LTDDTFSLPTSPFPWIATFAVGLWGSSLVTVSVAVLTVSAVGAKRICTVRLALGFSENAPEPD
jgi:hypothetical protein